MPKDRNKEVDKGPALRSEMARDFVDELGTLGINHMKLSRSFNTVYLSAEGGDYTCIWILCSALC